MNPILDTNDGPSEAAPEAVRASVHDLLGTSRPAPRPWRRLAFAGLAVVLVALVVAAASRARREGGIARYVTAEARTGDLVVTISATGTLQPVNKVDVGSELSGIVERVLVDENDRVRAGQPLVVLDPTKLDGQVARSRASLSSARARKAQAEASVADARARLARLEELFDLSGGRSPSRTETESARTTVLKALADEASAKAAIEEAEAALAIDEANLAKATIRSPVKGLVLTRNVEPGQTVAAALQAPVLFTLAEDLSKMDLEVDVDEADVARVSEGLPATFTVDAHPGRTFVALVKRVGFGSRTKDGVVSYRTILSVDNSDLSLRPGMTASVVVTTASRTGVLLVPNAALRFEPAATAEGQAPSRSIVSRLLPLPPGTKKTAATESNHASRVWVLRDGRPEAVPVTVGVSDGQSTELTGGGLRAGTAVVTELSGGAS
ncbi:MAG: efflux RND transporter periplasmic adaptor subunit [Holophagales bacterium]|nr:efflux RND transporter periplasmic adaptor subunit [Holophagales bacterium]MBK9964779.1 efflux RND transporter periplasmic adaptor subunit [Holophagales bacterium]